MAKRPRSEAQRAASRANGRRSRGPKTAAGKARSRRNALRHGLRASRFPVVAETDESSACGLIEAVRQRLAPRDVLEAECVEGIALAFWRLRRVRRLEEAILAGTEPEPGASDLAKAFSLRVNGTAAVGLLLRYRNQALGELGRWFRLLESRRNRAAEEPGSAAAAPGPTPGSADVANDNRPSGPLPPAPFS